ncbi:GNAT family N-acetyltransferase [Cytophagaceae bacterium YF14B1]|uniref:GNAT family N-acetyltransferase n=1 Tax=Xanthocytophaga flava TaxID=3048013 RepID=A0AAE3U7Y6_9BACT|nr:GNAT family N-acetyltransferase [Xanthocytophaga flavus]MDJ1483434.1 GNAT family N-acetyltransferase [Xanthocytophaga flavus]
MTQKVTYKLVKRTYLEFRKNSLPQIPDRLENVEIFRLENPTASFYLFLYKEVGQEFGWADRLLKTKEELLSIIQNPLVDIYVLYVSGVPAGYAEVDRQNTSEYFLTFFGLVPEFRGAGLGKYFLRWVIGKVFETNPEKLSLDTMDQDHPAALHNYLKAGFVIVDERIEKQTVIEEEN